MTVPARGDVDSGADAPRGLPRGPLVLLTLAAVVVGLAGVHAGADIVNPTFLALVLTIAVHPLFRWLTGRGVQPWLAVLASLLVVYGVLLALIASLVVSVARLAGLLPSYADEADGVLDDAAGFLADRGVEADEVDQLVPSNDFSDLLDRAGDLLGGVAGMLSGLFLLVALVLFLSVDAVSLPGRRQRLAAERPELVHALESFAGDTRRWLVVTTVFGLIVAVVDTAALWLLGVPLPVLWGLLAFVTNYIPNIGFLLGLVPPALLALLEGGVGLFVAVVVVYCVVNVVIQSVIQPKVVGDAVGLSATVSFLSLVLWAAVLGPLGALLAVPLTLLAKALLVDLDPSARWITTMFGAAESSPR